MHIACVDVMGRICLMRRFMVMVNKVTVKETYMGAFHSVLRPSVVDDYFGSTGKFVVYVQWHRRVDKLMP